MLIRSDEALEEVSVLVDGFGNREPGHAAFRQYQSFLENYLRNVCEEFTLFEDLDRQNGRRKFPRITVPMLEERRDPRALAVSMQNLEIQFVVTRADVPKGGVLTILGYDWFLG